jgi:hypothetical protein
MSLSQSPAADMRARLARTPAALDAYAAFEATVRTHLSAWPPRSAELATSFLMSVWTASAAQQGLIKLPASTRRWIAHAGRASARRLRGAERAWIRELAQYLMPGARVA